MTRSSDVELADAGDADEKPKRRRKRVVDPNDLRPTICLLANDIERIVDEAERALIRADRGLYQRDGSVVYVDSAPAITAHGVTIQLQRICVRDENALREDLSSAACFEKFDARVNDFVIVDPPMAIARTLTSRRGRLRLPILSGVINVPMLRADGSILDKPGYDAATGLIFDNLGVDFPPIPNQPTRTNAEKSLARLNDIIKDFDFVEPAHRAAALSGILTACCRRSLRTAPLHGYSAPVLGSGKSKLVDIASVIATGQEAAVIAQGANDEELEKRLVSHLLVGAPIIAIDNCSRPLGGDLLNQMLTQARASPRILGKSESPSVSTGALCTATGNNLLLFGDMVRRSIVCCLDPKNERPELRTFDRDPVEYAKANRSVLVVCAITILRAYHLAGRPNRPAPLGSFEEWSNLVRGALLWLGCADPVSTMQAIRDADPTLAILRMVMAAWRHAFGGEGVTAGEVMKKAIEQERVGVEGRFEFVNEDLREALLAAAGRSGAINTRALGNWLSANMRRIVDNGRFEQVGTRQGVAVWRLAITE